MRAKEVLRLLRISRPTIYRYRKKVIIGAQKLSSEFYEYNAEYVYRFVNKDIQRKTYLYARGHSKTKRKLTKSNRADKTIGTIYPD